MRVFNRYVALDYRQDCIEDFFGFTHSRARKERKKADGFFLVACRTAEHGC